MRRGPAWLAAFLLMGALPALGADEYMDLHCWAPVTFTLGGNPYSIPPTDRSSGVTWASPSVDQTDASGGTSTQSIGFEFPYNSQSEIHCSVVLPADYNTGGSPPQVTLEGWGIADSSCPPGNSPPIKFTFSASSRSYAAGEVANAGWSAADSETFGFTCPVFVQSKDIVLKATLDATPNASDWGASELVFIKISRSAMDTFTDTFHLARVRLRLPE